MWLHLIMLASAAAPAHYDPDQVAQRSSRYTATRGAMAPVFTQRQNEAKRTAAALEDWSTALDLLGPHAPPSEHDAYTAFRQQFNRDVTLLSEFASTQGDAVGDAFQAALDRALIALNGASWEACADPTRTLRMGPLTAREPCPGPDRSDDLAARIDEDPALGAAIDAILAKPWPTLTRLDAPGATPAGTHILDVTASLAEALALPLEAIDAKEEQERIPLEADIEAAQSLEARKALVETAHAIEARTAQRRAHLAAPILAAADKFARKKHLDFAWCARPAWLGGCAKPELPDDDAAKLWAYGPLKRAIKRAGSFEP